LSTPVLELQPKRVRADAARNRVKVLDAARAAFAEQGPDAQMEEIARRAGVGVGTVYRHFPTKQALAEALVEERFERTIAYSRELLLEPDPWQAIVKSFEFCATTQEQNRGWAGVLAAVAGGSGAMAPAEHQLGQLLAITTQMLDRAHAAGAIRPDLQPADMPPLYCGLAAVVQAGVADWRRYLELLLAGLQAPA
jgi:AcrR family transcriptional regulator